MKSVKLNLVIILSIVLFSSCSDDDNSSLEPEISGEWNLVKSTSIDNSVDTLYEEVLVTYTFDSNDNILTVVNNAIETTDLSPKGSGKLGSGTYTYSISTDTENTYLIVQNQELGKITFNQEQIFTLNQTETSSDILIDEFILYFER